MIIPDAHRSAFERLFDDIFLGNVQAKELGFMIVEVLHVWDDMHDRDREVTKEEANRAFTSAMFLMQQNPVYLSNPAFPFLIEDVYFKWVAANEFEAKGEQLDKAFILRAELYGLFTHIAKAVGGHEHAVSVSPLVWSFYGEDLNEFKKEVLKNA